MFRISKDSPAHYLTSVAKDRLPTFQTASIKEVVCAALDEARRSAGFLIFAYVVMTDHLHTIVGSELQPSKVLQFINGITSHRVIQYLKDKGYERSLGKLRHADRGRGWKHSLWDHHPNAKRLPTEKIFLQKVRYVHQNPVRAGLVERAEDYRWSSARYWSRKPSEDEPLKVDLDKIVWKSRR
jgi:REP element-mobilizing transposase RayT